MDLLTEKVHKTQHVLTELLGITNLMEAMNEKEHPMTDEQHDTLVNSVNGLLKVVEDGTEALIERIDANFDRFLEEKE